MADWDEIKKLAADFQRTQTSDTLQRISERNCIDIVKKLTELKLIDLIYTCDGKEFITPNHLLKEIEDEVYVNGGRVHLHSLATSLNVDYQHVENSAKIVVAERPTEYDLILGQIIHSTYKNTLEKQIYDTMISTGQLSIADFAKTLDLPSEFLSSVVKELLPRVMNDFVVSQDERTYYTTDMMDRYKSIIAGTLTAITKPTNIASIIKRLDIPERMFMPIVDGLVKDGRVDATVESRIYIPSVYAREQNEWVDKFYSSNSYVEYDLLLRKDIKQPKAFLKKRFPDGLQLKTCFVSPNIVLQVESMVEDCIATNGLLDISSILSPSIQAEDIDMLLHDIFKKNKQFGTSCLIINQTNICSLGYIATCKKSFTNMMNAKAQEHLKEGRLVSHFLGGQLKSVKKVGIESDKKLVEQITKKGDNLPAQEQVDTGKQANDEHKASEQTEESKKDELLAAGGKKKGQDIEMTVEDLKRERRNQKKGNKGGADGDLQIAEAADSDEDQGNKKSKGSRKSGGGAQGREIKQKSVKKKYLAGKGGKNNEDSDEEMPASSSKAPRSSKGRAARRGVSPDSRVGDTVAAAAADGTTRMTTSSKNASNSNNKRQSAADKKEPLVFLNTNELVVKLREQSREAGDFPDGMFKSIANMLESDLNKSYVSLAQKVLDDYMKSLEDEDESRDDSHGEGEEDEVDLID